MREHFGQSLSVGSGSMGSGTGSGGLPYTWVGSDQALFEMIEALGPVGAPQSQIVGMDSEFINQPGVFLLCVLQVQIGPNTYLIDTLEDLNIGLMRDFLQRQDLVFVLHAADQDIQLLHKRYGVTIPHLFDTQIAAKYVTGEGNTMGLKAVMEQFLGIEMPKDKKMTRSNWAIRPLSLEQCQYAALDTVHLITLYGTLREALTANGRFLWALEDSQEMMRRTNGSSTDVFKRVEVENTVPETVIGTFLSSEQGKKCDEAVKAAVATLSVPYSLPATALLTKARRVKFLENACRLIFAGVHGSEGEAALENTLPPGWRFATVYLPLIQHCFAPIQAEVHVYQSLPVQSVPPS